MTRTLAIRCCLPSCLLAACLFAVVHAGGQQPVFRGGSDIVRVFATVTDRDGKLVPKLAQDAFELRDDGKPQPITQFDNSPQPIRLIVMLDVSTSMQRPTRSGRPKLRPRPARRCDLPAGSGAGAPCSCCCRWRSSPAPTGTSPVAR